MTEAEELELLELENENESMATPQGGPAGGMGDVKMAESQAGQSQPYETPAYVNAQRAGAQPGAWDAAKPVARFAGDVAQAISTGPVNAAVQGVQDNWGDPIGMVGGVIANEAKNLASPFHDFENPIQSSGESLERAGVDNTPQRPPMRYPGEQFPGGDAPMMGLADQAGIVADVLTPPFAAAGIAKAAGATGRLAKDAVAAGKSRVAASLQPAAEKAILGNYRKQLRAEFLPDNPTEGTLKNFPRELSKTLKENDLLRPPEQAMINLNSGKERIGKAIESTIKKATNEDVSVNVQDVINNFANDTRSLLKRTGKGAGEIKGLEEKIIPQIQDIVNNLGPDELGNIPLDKGVEFRRGLQAMVKNWDGENRNIAQVVAKRLSSDMNKKIAASHKIHGPRLAKLNEKYSSLMDAEPMVEEAYRRAGGLESGPMINDRGLPLTKEGIVNQAARSIGSPREALMRMMPKTAEKIANDAYLPAGSKSALPEYTPPTPTVSADELSALGLDVGPKPKTLPPRTPQGRPALDKAPTYIPGQAKEGLPPRVPQGVRRRFEEKAPSFSPGQPKEGLPPRVPTGTRRPLEDKPPTYVRSPAEGLPPREPKNPRRPLGDAPTSPEAFLQVLADSKGWPPGLNEERIKRLVQAYKKSKPDAQKSKIMNLLRQEWAKAMESAK